MQHDLPAIQAYHHQYSGHTTRERTRKRWINSVPKSCLKQRLRIREATTVAYERTLTTTLRGIKKRWKKKKKKYIKLILGVFK